MWQPSKEDREQLREIGKEFAKFILNDNSESRLFKDLVRLKFIKLTDNHKDYIHE